MYVHFHSDEDSGTSTFRPFGGRVVEIGIHEYHLELQGDIVGTRRQVPFQLGWALTIHKSIGIEVNEVAVELKKCWGFGQVYTAISRVRTLRGLHILSLPTVHHVSTQMVSPKARNFYRRLT